VKARRGDDWTPADDDTIRRMAAANASAILIAARIKRTASAVKRRAWAKGIKIRSPQERRAEIKRADTSYP
jgi:hypothetical protein